MVSALCLGGCGGDDASALADAGSGGGGAAGAGGTGGMMIGAGSGGGGAGGVGGDAGQPPIGGMSATIDAAVEDAAEDAGSQLDAGGPRPFQSIDWPTEDAVVEVDAMGAFGTDVS